MDTRARSPTRVVADDAFAFAFAFASEEGGSCRFASSRSRSMAVRVYVSICRQRRFRVGFARKATRSISSSSPPVSRSEARAPSPAKVPSVRFADVTHLARRKPRGVEHELFLLQRHHLFLPVQLDDERHDQQQEARAEGPRRLAGVPRELLRHARGVRGAERERLVRGSLGRGGDLHETRESDRAGRCEEAPRPVLSRSRLRACASKKSRASTPLTRV